MDEKNPIYKPGSVLFTKDGSKCGNGIILKVIPVIAEQSDYIGRFAYIIETDFGNIFRLFDLELPHYYNVSERIVDISTWRMNKLNLVMMNIENSDKIKNRKLDYGNKN